MKSARHEAPSRSIDDHQETELKFGVDPARLAAIEAALSGLPTTSASIESHYFDTAERLLAKAGLSLRLRRSDQGWEQTLKGPGDSLVDRLEDTVQLPAAPRTASPAIDLGLHAGTRAGKLIGAALGDDDHRGGAILQPLFTTRVRRLSALVETADATVEVALDTGSIEHDGTTVPICELEYELKSGRAALLFELGAAGVVQHGMWLSVLSKSMRGDALASGNAGIAAAKARQPSLTRKMSGPAIYRAAVKSCFEQISLNASAVASGRYDDEVVHQLRIGLRRLRTAGRELAGLSGGPEPAWDAVVAQTFRSLGAYRDASTVAAALHDMLSAAGSPQPSLDAQGPEAPDPEQQVRSTSFQLALLQILADARESSDDSTAECAPENPRRRIASRLAHLHARLEKDAKRFEALESGQQHAVRKRLKRLRYLAELVGSLYDRGQVDRYVDGLRPAQDALGAHVDLLVGLKLARQAALSGGGDVWFNVGYLSAKLPTTATACRRALAKVAGLRPFW